MNGLIEFTHYQAEALIACLALSVAWAGVLFVGAKSIERKAPMTSAERLWAAALLFAVLPSLVAPTLAAFGVSLRPAPEPVFVETMTTYAPIASAPATQAAVEKPVFLTGEQLIGSAALIYVYGVVLAFFLWAAKNVGLHYAVARATDVTERRFLDHVDEWAERLGVKTPRIRRSRHVSSVCIFGVARQTILIPEGIDARVSSDDLLLMCAHELAHVRRGDTRLFTATQLTRVLFWFNPLVARIAAHAELAAEEGADALVIATGVDRRRYAATFVEGLKFAASKTITQPALAPSFTPPDRHGRRRRLNSILSPEPERTVRLSTRLMLSAAASSVALVAFGQAALAVDPDSASERRLKDLPLVGDITLGFGEKDEALGTNRATHEGVDIAAKKGAKVFAPADGVVVEATARFRDNPDWGKVVVIDHGHGLVTRYAHLDSYSVKKGDSVRAGDVIAAAGATGKTTGPHLHYETLKNGKPVDPVDAMELDEPLDPIEAADAIDPAPAVAPFEMRAPIPAVEPAPAAPAPIWRGFSFRIEPGAMKFPDFKIVNPVMKGTPLVSSSAKASALAFANGDAMGAVMGEDLEQRLLGALDGDSDVVYNLTFKDGDKVWKFSSDEKMSAEKRAELRRMLGEMRKEREEARKEALKHRDEWRRDAELAAREMERGALQAGREAEREALQAEREAELAELEAEREAELAEREAELEAMREAMAAHREAMREAEHEWRIDADELQAEIEMTKREALEAHRDALDDAAMSLDEAVAGGIDDAIASLDDAMAELDDYDLSTEERNAQLQAIEEARRQLERDRGEHRRAIEEARRDLEAQRREVERMIRDLDAGGASAP